MNLINTSINSKLLNISNNIFYLYLTLSPIIVIFMTLIGFNKYSFYFYILSTLVTGLYLTLELYLNKQFNYRVILYIILLTISLYQGIFFIKKIPYFQNYIFIQFLLISLMFLIFLNNDNLSKFKQFIIYKFNLIIFIYFIAIVFYITLFITKLGFKTVWGSRYFQGFFEFPHQASYEFFVLQGIGLMLYLLSKEKKYKYISLFIIVSSIFLNSLTGARTSFILSLIIFIPIIYIFFLENKKILLILIGVLITFIILNYLFKIINIENIPIIKKFAHSLSGKNHLFTSREFWDDLIIYWYNHFTLTEMLVGKGYGVSIYINGLIGFKGLWSHNDFIELLLSVGFIGLIYYLYLIINLVYNYKSYAFLIIIIGFGFLNGFFAYAYIFASIPVYLLVNNLFKDYKRLKE